MQSIFKTDGIRGAVGKFPITPVFLLKFGWVIGKFFASELNKKCVVFIGKDTRTSGYMLESALASGLSSAGVNICLLGVISTPAVSYLTLHFGADLGIVISASHNQYSDNGIKVFTAGGYKLSSALENKISLELRSNIEVNPSTSLGQSISFKNLLTKYIDFCKSSIPPAYTLNDFSIVLDCSHGAVSDIAPQIFCSLGANVTVINASPNGYNINDNCGSVYPNALINKVLEIKASIGISFDGDGDRVIMIDEKGNIIDGDDILYIVALYFQSVGKMKNKGVVGTFMSNTGLERSLTKNNIPFIRTAVGDRNICDMLQQKKWILGGEPCGHIVCLDKTVTGDGIIASLQVISAMIHADKKLHELTDNFEKLPQKLVNFVLDKNLSLDTIGLLDDMEERYNLTLTKDARLLVRISGTEPVIRILVESNSISQNNKIVDEVYKKIDNLVN